MEVVYSRDGQRRTTTLQPVQDADSAAWHAGIWVPRLPAGIGTLTFVDDSIRGIRRGLATPISDADTGQEHHPAFGQDRP